ncbi:hypothetical protein [Lysobacter capsici]|uniref:hypothetical protein n=1 Tax=Lysobacter capsici TaxID=435897 RepID=UPI0006278F54|nr:hypothetical protein [Lysobacter capsici]
MSAIRSCERLLKQRSAASIKGVVLLGLIAIPAVAYAEPQICSAPLHAAVSRLIDSEVSVDAEPKLPNFMESSALDQIEGAYGRYLAQRSKTSDGRWKSEILADEALTRLAELGTRSEKIDWSVPRSLTLKWADSAPNSALARVLYAGILVRQAIHATAYDDDFVSLTQAKRQPERDLLLRQADAYLEAETAVASRDPEYYATRMRIALLHNDGAKLERTFDQAMAKFPDYYPLYSLRLGGRAIPLDEDGVERLARQAVLRNPASEGRVLYARIYGDYAENNLMDQESLFAMSKVRWTEMKAGFEDLVQRYPDQKNLQTYAKFACFAGDSFKLYTLLHCMQAPLREVWTRQSLFDACHELGLTHTPVTL